MRRFLLLHSCLFCYVCLLWKLENALFFLINLSLCGCFELRRNSWLWISLSLSLCVCLALCVFLFQLSQEW
jgi:hypothetical protein